MIKWQKELDIFSDIKTMYVLEGNVYDIYPCGDNNVALDKYMNMFLLNKGYKNVLFFDPIHGFYNRFEKVDFIGLAKACGCDTSTIKRRVDSYLKDVYMIDKQQDNQFALVNWAVEIINKMMTSDELVVFVMNYASRYAETPDNLMLDERFSFLNLMYGSLNSHQIFDGTRLRMSAVYLIVDKINDIPPWFFINNPYFKSISIPLPDNSVRERFLTSDEVFGNSQEIVERESLKHLCHITEGMTCVEIMGLANLIKKSELGVDKIDDAVALYRYGIKENPWESINVDVLNNAENRIKERVKGQDAAITRAVDVIRRAASGMSGLQHSSSKSRPRGIMFFAGPTGVGKTELAKSISELLFNDENNCIRFDMSEYAQAQADQKLFGAPPGYVGYEAGGQLTNAVKNKPFCILLFDEIEKAHPSIWDKFLQILDDGRMTDGQGNTVYFSESIIIFTSNLGIYVNDEQGRKIKMVSPEDSYEDLEDKVIYGVKEYFNSENGKPEILNRIGNNVIVFQYINRESAREILEKQLKSVEHFMEAEKNIRVLTEHVKDELLEIAMGNIENGGRGIGNIVEEYVINPLARMILSCDNSIPREIDIIGFGKEKGVVTISYK